MSKTKREEIKSLLKRSPTGSSAKDISKHVGIEEDEAKENIRQVKKSLKNEEEMLAKKPVCRECSFDGFDNILQFPTKCPNCKSTAIEEPEFKIVN